MSYVPHTEAERAEMLKVVGAKSLEDLFSHLPAEFRISELKGLPPGLGEMELAAELRKLANKNRSNVDMACFLGAGAYDHFIPPVVFELISRGELYTAYTPYQPEISQGVLQLIYEYQTMIAGLCGCDVSNAGLYDGGTAVVEACQMAVRHTGKSGNVVLCGALHPHYVHVTKTALEAQGIQVKVASLPANKFASDESILAHVDENTACVAIGYPNFFGGINDLESIGKKLNEKGSLLVAVGSPFSFGLLKPPGEMGVDIVCGEAQALGVPLQFGGPYVGYLACKKDLVRKMPGRLVGQTCDMKQRRAFTLTLQAREQHIRREKATSNICTNTALCAMMAHFYMSALGKSGLKRAGELCVSKTDLLRRKLKGANGVKSVPEYPVFNEFVYETEKPAAQVLEGLLAKGILGGMDMGRYDSARKNQVLVCVTEKRSVEEIEAYVKAL